MLHFIVASLLCAFLLNFFFNLSAQVEIITYGLAAVFMLVMVIRYKITLLLCLAFLVPVSVPLTMGTSKITVPVEIICLLLSGFLFIKLLLGHKFNKEFLKNPITILILIDLAWMFITSCTSQEPGVSFKRLIIRLLYYISFYYFYFELLKVSRKYAGKVFLLYCLGFLIPIVKATIFHSTLGFTSLGAQVASAPFYNDHTMYGAALVFFIPFLFLNIIAKKSLLQKSGYFFLLLIFLGAAFLSYSRAAWLSLICAVIIGLILRYKISYRFIIPAILIGTFFIVNNWATIEGKLTANKEVSHSNNVGTHFKSVSNLNTDASNKERINRWKCALRMFADKPIFGFGPGTYQFFYGAYQQRKDMTTISTFNGLKGHAHSEYLNYLSENGIIGLLLFLCLITTVMLKAIRVYKASNKENSMVALYVLLGLFTFFIHAFFNGFIEFGQIAMPVFVSYALIAFLDMENKNSSSSLDSIKF